MRKRGKKELGKDYLLKASPILPSIPGKPKGRGRKAAMASKKKVLDRPIMRPTPRESHEQPVDNIQVPPDVTKELQASPTKEKAKVKQTQDAQTSPMKSITSREAEIEDLEVVRNSEVLLMSTKLRGRDTKITEAQLKGDKKTLRELVKIKDREPGHSAAKAVEAARQKRKLETGKNDRKGVQRFTWFLDRRASDSEKDI